MEVMPSAKTLDRIDEVALDDGMYQEEGVYANDLSGISGVRGDDLLVDEGADIKPIEYRAVNFISLGIFYPEWTVETLKEKAPNYFDELELPETTDSPADDMQALATGNRYARKLGYVKWLAKVSADLDSRDRDPDRYNYTLFRRLVESNSNGLNIDTNPWETKAFLCRAVPKRIHTNDPDAEEDDYEMNSAVEAGW